VGYVLDTAFLVDLLRADPAAKKKARELDASREPKIMTTPVLYEILAGLLFTRSRSEAAAFQQLSAGYVLAPFDETSASKAAEIRAELMRLGRVKSHVDTMIAGIASAGRHTMITRDSDFAEIRAAMGLLVEPY
jgi:predicted nucleic acid-binding protein